VLEIGLLQNGEGWFSERSPDEGVLRRHVTVTSATPAEEQGAAS
jgi:hypothetical protein